jgi:membrane protein YdbS with pleckstrin-like domain
MLDPLRNAVLAALRVPPEPHAPEGSPGSVRIFRAGRNFFRWQLLSWSLAHLSAILGVILAYTVAWRWVEKSPAWAQWLFATAEIGGVIGIVFAIPFSFLALRWQYELRWYMVTDRSLRIRRGVWNVEELTMTFANIQEIRVRSGPIQTFLGLANVEVTSAGGGANEDGHRSSHIASFEGVDNAPEIRDLLVERLRSYRDSGLGTLVAEPAPHSSAATLAAAEAVLAETKSLRAALN